MIWSTHNVLLRATHALYSTHFYSASAGGMCLLRTSVSHDHTFVVITITFSSFMTYHTNLDKSNSTGATCGTGTLYTSGSHEGFMFLNHQFSVKSLVDHCYFFFVWPLYFLFFFGFGYHLVSSDCFCCIDINTSTYYICLYCQFWIMALWTR